VGRRASRCEGVQVGAKKYPGAPENTLEFSGEHRVDLSQGFCQRQQISLQETKQLAWAVRTRAKNEPGLANEENPVPSGVTDVNGCDLGVNKVISISQISSGS
jgi:hypothetical protein